MRGHLDWDVTKNKTFIFIVQMKLFLVVTFFVIFLLWIASENGKKVEDWIEPPNWSDHTYIIMPFRFMLLAQYSDLLHAFFIHDNMYVSTRLSCTIGLSGTHHYGNPFSLWLWYSNRRNILISHKWRES